MSGAAFRIGFMTVMVGLAGLSGQVGAQLPELTTMGGGTPAAAGGAPAAGTPMAGFPAASGTAPAGAMGASGAGGGGALPPIGTAGFPSVPTAGAGMPSAAVPGAGASAGVGTAGSNLSAQEVNRITRKRAREQVVAAIREHMARGDYAGALREISIAEKTEPNDSLYKFYKSMAQRALDAQTAAQEASANAASRGTAGASAGAGAAGSVSTPGILPAPSTGNATGSPAEGGLPSLPGALATGTGAGMPGTGGLPNLNAVLGGASPNGSAPAGSGLPNLSTVAGTSPGSGSGTASPSAGGLPDLTAVAGSAGEVGAASSTGGGTGGLPNLSSLTPPAGNSEAAGSGTPAATPRPQRASGNRASGRAPSARNSGPDLMQMEIEQQNRYKRWARYGAIAGGIVLLGLIGFKVLQRRRGTGAEAAASRQAGPPPRVPGLGEHPMPLPPPRLRGNYDALTEVEDEQEMARNIADTIGSAPRPAPTALGEAPVFDLDFNPSNPNDNTMQYDAPTLHDVDAAGEAGRIGAPPVVPAASAAAVPPPPPGRSAAPPVPMPAAGSTTKDAESQSAKVQPATNDIVSFEDLGIMLFPDEGKSDGGAEKAKPAVSGVAPTVPSLPKVVTESTPATPSGTAAKRSPEAASASNHKEDVGSIRLDMDEVPMPANDRVELPSAINAGTPAVGEVTPSSDHILNLDDVLSATKTAGVGTGKRTPQNLEAPPASFKAGSDVIALDGLDFASIGSPAATPPSKAHADSVTAEKPDSRIGEETLHSQDTVQLPGLFSPKVDSDASPAKPTAAAQNSSGEQTVALDHPAAAIDLSAFEATATVRSGGHAGSEVESNGTNHPSTSEPTYGTVERNSGGTLDERSERMFREQCERADKAEAEGNWKQVVHFLSIAAAIHPENNELSARLKKAREEKRKLEAQSSAT